jgi:hypothetical protein
MIRKRFPASRLARLAGWTAMAVAWVGAGILRLGGGEAAAVPEPAVPEPVEQAPAAATAEPALPALPASGLTVIRYTPSAAPEPQVVTRVVEKRVVRPAPAAAAAPAPAPAAPRPTSSGS